MKTLKTLSIACGLFAWASVTPDASADSLLLRGGILHTISGPTLTNASILSRDGRIEAVGAAAEATADTVVDLGGRHVFPGLIAMITQLGLVEIDAVRATVDIAESGAFTPDVYSWVSVNPDSELLPVALANGYTHFQPTPVGGVVSGHSAVMTSVGWTIEEMAVRRSAGLHVNWPSFTLNLTPKDQVANKDQWKSPEDQIKERDKRLKEIDQFFDDAEAYVRAKTNAAAGTFRTVPAWEGMLTVLKGEEPVFLDAEEKRQIESAVGWAKARKYRAVISGGRDAWRVAGLLASNSIPVAFGHTFTLPARDVDPYDAHYAAAGVLEKAGVRIAFSGAGDRFGASNVRNLPYAAAQAVAFGMTHDGALRALTLEPARLLGVDAALGSLETGKDATFVIATGDILDLRTKVERLWIRGREVPVTSKHTRLFERYRGRPRK